VALVQDPDASVRLVTLATRSLVDSFPIDGESDEMDRDACDDAANWALRLLNSRSFFTSHPTLILQVFSSFNLCRFQL
jgi:hypothetical protein